MRYTECLLVWVSVFHSLKNGGIVLASQKYPKNYSYAITCCYLESSMYVTHRA